MLVPTSYKRAPPYRAIALAAGDSSRGCPMQTLFDPIELRHLSLKNRLVRSATAEGLAGEDGTPSEAMLAVYEKLAMGGVAACITGYTAIDPDERGFRGMTRISDDCLIEGWKPLVATLRAGGCRAIMQLGLETLRVGGRLVTPGDATYTDLGRVVKLFGEGARRAQAAGFDGVQLHAAHSMWLASFLRAGSNHRTDCYGGSQANRVRLLVEVLDSVRRATVGLHVSMKVNGFDRKGGMTMEEALETCLIMADEHIDSIEVSGDRSSRAGVVPGRDEAYFLPFARKLKRSSSVPVILVGGNRSAQAMEDVINSDDVDMIAMSRPLVREPDLPNRWMRHHMAPSKCPSCNACHNTRGRRCLFVMRGMAG